MNGWQYYGTHELQLIPYMEGTPVWKDGLLSTLYYATKEENKLGVTFCGDVMDHDTFVSFFHKRKTMQVLCEIENDKTIKPVGYAWVDLPRGVDGAMAVMCGFCFFKGSSKRESAQNLGRLGLAYWFIDMKIDVIHGVLLESNIPGRNYATALGFREICIVPKYHYDRKKGELVGARVMMIEKGEFIPGFEKWFETQKLVATAV
jgi:hypothetical protein